MPPSTSDDMIPSVASKDNEETQGTNLADLILEKIAAHEATNSDQRAIPTREDPGEPVELPAKVVEVYSKYCTLARCELLIATADFLSLGLVSFYQDTRVEHYLNHSS